MKVPRIKFLVVALSVFHLTLSASFSNAGEFGDIKAKMNAAREAVVVMLKDKDQRGADQQKLVKESADEVSALLAATKAPAGQEAEFKSLVTTWSDFKKTREDELVPLILSGKDEDARKIAAGVQKERFEKMMGIVDALNK